MTASGTAVVAGMRGIFFTGLGMCCRSREMKIRLDSLNINLRLWVGHYTGIMDDNYTNIFSIRLRIWMLRENDIKRRNTELAVRVLRCSLYIFKIAAIFITDVIFIISCILWKYWFAKWPCNVSCNVSGLTFFFFLKTRNLFWVGRSRAALHCPFSLKGN